MWLEIRYSHHASADCINTQKALQRSYKLKVRGMTTLNRADVVRARIETKVKRDAESILKRLGVSHSTFINMSYRAVVETGGIPFSLHVPNKATARVLKAARKPAARAGYTKVETLEALHAALRSPNKN